MKANQYIAKFVSTIDNLEREGKNVPGLILSHAGFGKTSTIKRYCEYKDYNLITLIPSMYSADDILGLQTVENGRLVRLTPAWFNNMVDIMANGKRTVLFVDEITTCDPYIQGPLLDLIFNGNLGGKKLPSNVFIVAAGNYSDDLNNNFKMSAPLVNRFVVLNLKSEDFDIQELLDVNFEEIDNLEEYLGITCDIPSYDYNLFKEWVKDSGEVSFGKTCYEEDELMGLTGFTSIRSISNILKFTESYLGNYNDSIWTRIVGDTLGRSARREGKYMNNVIYSALSLFKATKKESYTLEDILMEHRTNGASKNLFKMLNAYVSNVSVENTSMEDVTKITNLLHTTRQTNEAESMALIKALFKKLDI